MLPSGLNKEKVMAEKALQVAWISNIIFEPYMQACINGAFMPTGDRDRKSVGRERVF